MNVNVILGQRVIWGDGLGANILKPPGSWKQSSRLFHSPAAGIIFATMTKPRNFCEVTGHRSHTHDLPRRGVSPGESFHSDPVV